MGLLISELPRQGTEFRTVAVARLTALAGITAQIGYKRRPAKCGRKLSFVVNNTLGRQFDVEAPAKV
ncbi:hypothetical protein AYJ57_14795 [Salipiger sp. CCB-MM3]|nr:hypothetical protein AYJ57_14795 [Salipiger sp. CCB-MM3]